MPPAQGMNSLSGVETLELWAGGRVAGERGLPCMEGDECNLGANQVAGGLHLAGQVAEYRREDAAHVQAHAGVRMRAGDR